MPNFDYFAQKFIYDTLNGAITATVYDDLPRLPEGLPDANYPFVALGATNNLPWDTDDTLGQEVMVNLHLFSRYDGMKEAKEITGEVYDLLHRASGDYLTDLWRVVDCLFDSSSFITLNDGKTRYGLLTYRLTIHAWEWILITGTWNDDYTWVDVASWIDS